MKSVLLMLVIVAAILPSLADARQDAKTDAMSTVEVSNARDPDLRSYAQMLKGLRAYEEKHKLAPDSNLYFILLPKSRNVDLKGVTMRLASDDESIDIPIDEDGKFKLPLLQQKTEDEYDLILNKPKGLFKIKPFVKSEGIPGNTKRLGDLRLECEVRWAIERQDVSAVFSTYVKLLGSGNPCTSRFVAVGFSPPVGTDIVLFDSPKKKIELKVKPYENYSLPLWNQEFGNDELVKYQRHAQTAHFNGDR